MVRLKALKRIILIALAVAIGISFSGCRVRTTKLSLEQAQVTAQPKPEQAVEGQKPNGNGTSNADKGKPDESNKPEAQRKNSKKPVEKPKKSPDSVREVGEEKKQEGEKTVIPDKEKPSDDNGGSINNDENESEPSDRNDLTEKDENEEMTYAEEIIRGYHDMLSTTNATISAKTPCNKPCIYMEDENGFSVANGEPESEIITRLAGYNIFQAKTHMPSAELIEEQFNLNPSFYNLIIKIYDDGEEPEGVAQSLIEREGWDELSGNYIILLSGELLGSREGMVYAELFIAKAVYPSFYEGLDLNKAYFELFGAEPSGELAYFYEEV